MKNRFGNKTKMQAVSSFGNTFTAANRQLFSRTRCKCVDGTSEIIRRQIKSGQIHRMCPTMVEFGVHAGTNFKGEAGGDTALARSANKFDSNFARRRVELPRHVSDR
jgi:hypothetical protein